MAASKERLGMEMLTIAEAAEVLHRRAARHDVVQELTGGRPAMTDKERREIDRDLKEGWAHARRTKKRPRAA